jgi:hypothetical protein
MVAGELTHIAKTETVNKEGKESQRKPGDGVRARLISSRQGELGMWAAHGEKEMTEAGILEVTAGETLDFVVDGCQDGTDDRFDWPVTISTVHTAGGRADATCWSSRVDFRGPQADSWQQFAQALLMTNEFMFVD